MWSALQTSYLDPGAGHTHSPPSLLQKHRAASGVAIQTADILVSPQGGIRGPGGVCATGREPESHSSKMRSHARLDYSSFPGVVSLSPSSG